MGLFGKAAISGEEYRECLAYWEAELRLRALHRQKARAYSAIAERLEDMISQDRVAGEEMCKAANESMKMAQEIVRHHDEMVAIPEAASAMASASHSMYVAWAAWATANASFVQDRANGLTPNTVQLEQLHHQRQAARRNVEDEERRLAKTLRLKGKDIEEMIAWAIAAIGDGELLIGKDISWERLAARMSTNLLRITDFTRLATVEGEKVTRTVWEGPNGMIRLESPELEPSFTVLLWHRLDYLHVWRAFEWCASREQEFRGTTMDEFREWCRDADSSQQFEVLVGDFSQRRHGIQKRLASNSAYPRLFVWVCGAGSLERAISRRLGSDTRGDDLGWLEPVARWKPEV